MKALVTNKGTHVVVDDDTYEWAKHHTWFELGKYIARTSRETGNKVYLHREVLNAQEGRRVDARNGDYTDCRRSNLRFKIRNKYAPGKVEHDMDVVDAILEILQDYQPKTEDEEMMIKAFRTRTNFTKRMIDKVCSGEVVTCK